MVVLAIVQAIAVISMLKSSHCPLSCAGRLTESSVELTCEFTGSWGQFTAGRFLAYISSGLAEMAVTHYNGEVAPASVRGLLAGSMLLSVSLVRLSKRIYRS